MQVLKIATAGSVDDGKSTLIGRLLYDTHSLTDDKLEAIEKSSRQRGYDYLDFSLATDGLVAEREQGITIDVAHIYWSTPQRSYIIADTPGHIEYTRNMVTGASTSQAAIILVDARHGVVEQTLRHFYVNNLLRVKNVIVAVNKMDLINFSESHFLSIQEELNEISRSSAYKDQILTFIPISALYGDNVASISSRMPWYNGSTLLDYLESLESEAVYDKGHARFPVQTVIRPKSETYHDYRGYAGKLYGNDINVGDSVTILPSGNTSKVKAIQFFDENYKSASPGDSLTLTLEDDINVSRGDMIVKSSELPRIDKHIKATVCWMDQAPLEIGSKYILQHGVHQVLSKVSNVNHINQPGLNQTQNNANQLSINQIGEVNLKLNQPIFIDNFADNKQNGAFILIDTKTNTTAGVGFVTD